jgi:hypothetical protein
VDSKESPAVEKLLIPMIAADVELADERTTNCPVARAVIRHFSNNTGKPAITAEAAFSCVLAGEDYYDLDEATRARIRTWDNGPKWPLPHTIELTYAFRRNMWYQGKD